MPISKENLKLVYVPEHENEWKFLCIVKNEKLYILFNYNGDEFIGLELYNERYKIRNATEEDINIALLKNI